MSQRTRVLFLCAHNGARSQIAQGLLNALGPGAYEALSAGLTPSEVRPEAIAVLKEVGIDISHHHSKTIDSYAGQDVDLAVTVCDDAKEACPVFPGAKRQLHWPIPDPTAVQGNEAKRLEAFRKARDEITRRLEDEILGPR